MANEPVWLRRFARLAQGGVRESTPSPSAAIVTAPSAPEPPPVTSHHNTVEYDTDAWLHFYEERAAIRQFDAKLRCGEAERLAYEETLLAWHRAHARHADGQCSGCDGVLSAAHATRLPDGAPVHVDRPECHVGHNERWRAAAAAALTLAGITPPLQFSKETTMTQPTTDAAKTSGTNDNLRDRSNAWMQGYTDGQKEKWDVQLADQDGPVGEDYLDGWSAGRRSKRSA